MYYYYTINHREANGFISYNFLFIYNIIIYIRIVLNKELYVNQYYS